MTISGTTGFTWKFFWVGKENLAPAELFPPSWTTTCGSARRPTNPTTNTACTSTFRGYWDYDGGGLTDMGQHYMDPVQYLLGKDETSPVKVEVDAPAAAPRRRGHLA